MRSPLRRIKRKAKQAALPRLQDFADTRNYFAHRYLKGGGLEIGALHFPQPLPAGVTVRYVDRMTVPELREHYPELGDAPLVEPDIVDDGETLKKVKAASADFIIANHFLEHTEDPIGTLKAHLRVLKTGGVLMMGIPDMRFTFDQKRPLTTVEHLADDHRRGPRRSRLGHYREWAVLVERVPKTRLADRIEEMVDQRYSIHFHTWVPESFAELVLYCRNRLRLPLELLTLQQNQHEFLVILRKTRPPKK